MNAIRKKQGMSKRSDVVTEKVKGPLRAGPCRNNPGQGNGGIFPIQQLSPGTPAP